MNNCLLWGVGVICLFSHHTDADYRDRYIVLSLVMISSLLADGGLVAEGLCSFEIPNIFGY